MFDVISIGSAIRDIIFEIKPEHMPSCLYKEKIDNQLLCFHYGEKIEPKKAYFSFGGGGANSAISFSRLGLKSALCSSLGKDGTADVILDHFKKEKVNVSLINYDKSLHTALSFIIVGLSGERTIFPYAGASGDLNFNSSVVKKLASTKWIYLTTLRDKAQKCLQEIEKLLKKNRAIRFAFNPGETELDRGLKKIAGILKRTTVLILNKEEATYLVSSNERPKNYKIDYLLKYLKDKGPEMVLITDGVNGAFLFDGKKRYSVTVPKIKTVEQTGAGDAFGSGFIAGLQIYNDISLALKLASLNALSVIKKFGSQEGLLKLNQVRNINTIKIKNF